jgi:hypothetical protein
VDHEKHGINLRQLHRGPTIWWWRQHVRSERGLGLAHAVSRRASNKVSITDMNISLCHAIAFARDYSYGIRSFIDKARCRNMSLQQHVVQQMPQLSHLQQLAAAALLHPAVTTLELHFTPQCGRRSRGHGCRCAVQPVFYSRNHARTLVAQRVDRAGKVKSNKSD